MANEITYQFQILLRNGNLQDQYSSNSKTANQATASLVRNVQAISADVTGFALDLGGVAVPGFAVFQNLDATNFVEIGSFSGGTFYPFLKLKAGEQQLARISVAAPYARADTAPVNLFYLIYDD